MHPVTETQNSVRLGEIIKEFHLELLHEGEDYQNIPLRTLDVNRPGLPLSGFFEHFDTKRLLVMGLTETTYVSGMSEERRRESFDRLLSYPVPALIYTRGIDPFPECMEMAQKYGRTVLRTQEQTSAFMSSLIGSLYNHLAPRITRSGVMMEIYGEGVLFQGESGVGKSEVAIELIKRGHRIIADDAVELLRDLEEELDFSPEELDELEGRLDTIYRLKKKYGSTVEEMLDYLERSRQELDQIQYADDTIARLSQKLEKAREEAVRRAGVLSQARRRAAEALQTRVQEELRQLDMPKVRFQVEFAPKEGAWGLDETGGDEVQFLMSANVGEALKPIQKVASGGELARIMLALKNVLAEDDGIDSLVFDEVDTGVSGRAAQKVAEKMAQVARKKQVLCVTHLPQIAAMADTHFSVEKGERDGRTYTRVERLDRAGRIEELARLIGGAAVTPALRRSAEELLDQAEAVKKK